MADGFYVNTTDSPHSRLKYVNNSLIRNLRQGQKEIRSILKKMQARKSAYLTDLSQETSFTVRGLDRTPSSVQRLDRKTDYSTGATSTPKSYRDALSESGNDRRNRTLYSSELTPNSILRTSTNNRSKKTPKRGLHVSFQSSPHIEDENRNVIDDNLDRRSMLGYDWIAGILDNTSYIAEKSDDFFDDLKEFRRVNKDECYSKTISEPSLKPYRSITPLKKDHEDFEDKESYSCENTYKLNERLFAERIHSSDESCHVCYTKPQPEYETQGSYVRVSVPRSTLMSPYKVKPHRRVSFDPTDSIGLSSHCLAGWESSKPAVVPSHSSLDLKASLHKTRETLDASRAGRYSPDHQSTRDLLDRSHSLRYGLQVLNMERGISDKAHTTSFPAF
ncbi:migration and invasion-inhibitory protein-like [Actinia tenebrosa]|uniref:Migration and invasion-inhibitory protein-like n=1 Tax=Actinia tenebrosa TaxID=6105 RepID=A0A6P8J6S4_ACTTE|nr:migration and invasion-inhibitory protein-like [Actinia tenebrosa]